MPFSRQPQDPDFLASAEWWSAVRNIAWGIAPTANAYSIQLDAHADPAEHYHYLQHRTNWIVENYIEAGCARVGVSPVSLFDNRPIPVLWAELDVELQRQAQALHADIRRCGLSDHALRAEIFERVYGWLGDEFTKAWEAFESDMDRATVELAMLKVINDIDESRNLRELARRVSRPDLQYERIDNAVTALDDRLENLPSAFWNH